MGWAARTPGCSGATMASRIRASISWAALLSAIAILRIPARRRISMSPGTTSSFKPATGFPIISATAVFATARTTILGPNSSLQLSLGDQGTWGMTAGYDSISYAGNIINSIYTMHGTTGRSEQRLPAIWRRDQRSAHTGTHTSFTTTTLSPAEQEFQVGTRRDIFQLVGKYLFGDWTVIVQHPPRTQTRLAGRVPARDLWRADIRDASRL